MRTAETAPPSNLAAFRASSGEMRRVGLDCRATSDSERDEGGWTEDDPLELLGKMDPTEPLRPRSWEVALTCLSGEMLRRLSWVIGSEPREELDQDEGKGWRERGGRGKDAAASSALDVALLV